MADIKAKKVLFKNRDGEHLIPYVGDTAIDHRITNCLLEVPQNIKLELNNGTLTLKKGSKVIVPNGAGVFNEVVIQQDISLGALSLTQQHLMIFVNKSGTSFGYRPASDCLSGTSDPNTKGTNYYNTSTNIIMAHNSASDTQMAFPIAEVTSVSGVGFTSVNQIFNGFGYIGSHIWMDKGVKVLVANGINDDGTIKNEEIVTPDVLVSRNSSGGTRSDLIPFLRKYPTNNQLQIYSITKVSFLGELDYVPTVGSSFQWYFNTSEMKWYMHEAGATEWVNAPYYNISPPITVVNSVITSFEPYKPFRAVDYNGFQKLHVNSPYFFGQYIWSEFAPDNLSWLKSSGQWNSGTGYQAFYDWALANANANKAGFKLSTASYTDYDFVVNTNAKTFRLPIKVKQTFFNSGDVPVVGNGKTLGVQSNNDTVLSLIGSANGVYNLANYDSVRGSTPAQNSGYVYKTLGVTTDASKSGLVAKLSSVGATGLSLYFYVGETVRDEFLIDVAQIASNFADKIGRTECKAYITQTYVNGTSWYRVWSDGWKEQGGYLIMTATVTTLTFLKSFTNANYTIVGTKGRGDTTNSRVVNFSGLTANTVNVSIPFNNGLSTDYNVNWYACGY